MSILNDEDPITFEEIEKDKFIIIHNKIYNIESIYKWVILFNNYKCPFRIDITEYEKNNIINTYNKFYQDKDKYEYNNKIYYDSYKKIIQFSDKINNDDIIILKNNKTMYVYGTYFANICYYYVLGKKNINDRSGEYLDIQDIIGYKNNI